MSGPPCQTGGSFERRPFGGLSPWWPTPARPVDHFTSSELEHSAVLHRPLTRIRVGLVMAELALLVAVAWLVGTAGPLAAGLEASPRWVRALVGASAVVAAVRVPEAMARRRVGRLGTVDATEPGSRLAWPGRAAVSLAAVTLPAGALAVAAVLLLGPLTDRRSGWLVALAVSAVVMAATIVATWVRGRRAAEVEIPPAWESMVERSGLDGRVTFGLLAGTEDRPSGPNACALGAAGRRWILVDPSMHGPTAALPPSLRDFIVAHELSHLARRHPEVQLVLHGAVVVTAFAAVPALAATGWPWSLLGLAPDDPRSLPVVALIVAVAALLARIPVAWVMRALERIADAGAVELVGLPGRATARLLHLASGSDLDPPSLSMLMAVRPSPAQRLEYLDRCRRATQIPASTSASSATSAASG